MATANIRAVITAEDQASRVLNKFGTNVSDVAGKMKTGVRNASLAFAAATTAAVTFAVKSASEFEQSRVAFDTMLGSAEAGKKMMKELSDFARKTPFELPDVVEGAKKLLAYGISAKDVMKDLQTLGDISAGVGREKLPMLTLAFGQVATKGKLAGQEIRQFTEAGVPLIEELAKSLGKTKEEITKMSEEGDISFEQVRVALSNMTGEGGKFFKLMDKQSKTFGGVVSNIKDQVGRLARSIVGISDTGEIREGSIFAKLSKAGQELLVWLDDNSGKITEKTQEIVDKLMKSGQEFAKQFIDNVKSDGFASAVSQAFIDMLGKINWSGIAEKAVELFFIIAPQIITGFIKGLIDAAKNNPLNFALLFIALGFTPPIVLGALATVLSGIPIIGPILAWVLKGFGSAAGAVLAPLRGIFAKLFAGAISAPLAIALAAALVAFKVIMDKAKDVNKTISNTNRAIDQAGQSMDAALRRLQQEKDPAVRERLKKALKESQLGGAVSRGQSLLVGERRPEMFVPREAGRIVPQPRLGGGSNQTINLNVNIGMYAGTEMEKRKIAESLMRAWKDVQQARGVV